MTRPVVSVLAQKFGKRPQFLFAAASGTLGTVICIIGSQQSSYNTLLAGRMVQGLGMTAWESLSLAAMGEMFYLHERGWRTAVCISPPPSFHGTSELRLVPKLLTVPD